MGSLPNSPIACPQAYLLSLLSLRPLTYHLILPVVGARDMCSHSCVFSFAADLVTDALFHWGIRSMNNGLNHMIVNDLARLEPYVTKHLQRFNVAPTMADLASLAALASLEPDSDPVIGKPQPTPQVHAIQPRAAQQFVCARAAVYGTYQSPLASHWCRA